MSDLISKLTELVPLTTAERLGQTLTARDVETLQHLARKAVSSNSLKAIGSDLGYLEAWHLAVYRVPLPWPAPVETAIAFIAHHLFDGQEVGHGMPEEVKDQLYTSGHLSGALPHAPSTVRRRLSHWRKLHVVQGLPATLNDDAIRETMGVAIKASDRTPTRKSKTAITADILHQILSKVGTCQPIDIRDRAMLTFAFATGGRRRSEVTGMRLHQLEWFDPEGNKPGHYRIYLGRRKGVSAVEDTPLFLVGEAASELARWLGCLGQEIAPRGEGALFRAISKERVIGKRALDPYSFNLILKKRAERAGFDPARISAHGFRSGYLTTARSKGVPLEAAMQRSQHKDAKTAMRYYDEADGAFGEASLMFEK